MRTGTCIHGLKQARMSMRCGGGLELGALQQRKGVEWREKRGKKVYRGLKAMSIRKTRQMTKAGRGRPGKEFGFGKLGKGGGACLSLLLSFPGLMAANGVITRRRWLQFFQALKVEGHGANANSQPAEQNCNPDSVITWSGRAKCMPGVFLFTELELLCGFQDKKNPRVLSYL